MDTDMENQNSVLNAVTSHNSNAFHTAEEWEHWRTLITQLYSTEDKTLKVVRKILAEQYDFHAT